MPDTSSSGGAARLGGIPEPFAQVLDVDLRGHELAPARWPAGRRFHPDVELLVDLPQGGVQFPVADDVVVDDVVAQRR